MTTDPRFLAIAQAEASHIETLETRGRDCLDFHDVSVSAIREMMRKAYELGKADAKQEQRRMRFGRRASI